MQATRIVFKYESLICSYTTIADFVGHPFPINCCTTSERCRATWLSESGKRRFAKCRWQNLWRVAQALPLSRKFERDGRRFHNELKEAGSDE